MTGLKGCPAGCRAYLRGKFAERGIDATVSTAAPLAAGRYQPGEWTCPHGRRFLAEPTGEQIARWVRDGALRRHPLRRIAS